MMSAQNGGCGVGYCYQDVWHHGRDTSRNTTLLEWPGVMLDAGRIIPTRYVMMRARVVQMRLSHLINSYY